MHYNAKAHNRNILICSNINCTHFRKSFIAREILFTLHPVKRHTLAPEN